MNRVEMVCGFVFNSDYSKVMLIRKNRPSFLKGMLNGIGGKIEANETALNAMMRECHEETGLVINIQDWKLYLTITEAAYSLYWYVAVVSDDILNQAKSMTDEYVDIFNTTYVTEDKDVQVAPNVVSFINQVLKI